MSKKHRLNKPIAAAYAVAATALASSGAAYSTWRQHTLSNEDLMRTAITEQLPLTKEMLSIVNGSKLELTIRLGELVSPDMLPLLSRIYSEPLSAVEETLSDESRRTLLQSCDVLNYLHYIHSSRFWQYNRNLATMPSTKIPYETHARAAMTPYTCPLKP